MFRCAWGQTRPAVRSTPWHHDRSDSVVNVSQIITLDKRQLSERVGAADHDTLGQIDAGLRLALDLIA